MQENNYRNADHLHAHAGAAKKKVKIELCPITRSDCKISFIVFIKMIKYSNIKIQSPKCNRNSKKHGWGEPCPVALKHGNYIRNRTARKKHTERHERETAAERPQPVSREVFRGALLGAQRERCDKRKPNASRTPAAKPRRFRLCRKARLRPQRLPARSASRRGLQSRPPAEGREELVPRSAPGAGGGPAMPAALPPPPGSALPGSTHLAT